MAETVGRVEIIADIDGKALDRQVRALAEKVGQVLSSKINGDTGKKFDDLSKKSDNLTKSLDRQTSAWKRLPHGFRQFTFYTGLFAALSEEIAILGSVAGSSFTILASAATSAGIGVGTAIAAFQDFGGEISELPAAVQPAATAFQALGDAFGRLQDQIQVGALQQTTGAWESLATTVDQLTPAFDAVSGAVGNLINQFAAAIAPGTEGFDNLFRIIEGAAPIFEILGRAAIIFGDAIGDIFVVSLPFVEAFAGHLAVLAEKFSQWTSSLEGQNALEEWFQTGADVMQAIEPLLGAVSQALNALVTPESVALFVELLNTVTDFTPELGQLLGVIGDLNVFGLLADLLDVVLTALSPIIPLLSQMATILSEGLSQAFYALQPALTALFVALGPILPLLAQLAVDILIQLIPAITALTPLFLPLSELIISVLNSIIPLIPTITSLVVSIISGLIPVLIPLIENFARIFTVIEPLMPLIVTLINIALAPVAIAFEVVIPIIGKLIELFSLFWAPIDALIKPIGDLIGQWDGLDMSMGQFADQLGGWADGIIGAIDSVIGWVNDAINAFANLFGASANAPTPPGSSDFGPGFASGGIVSGARYRLTGEAGPEAIVPLNRPLSQVSPDVRALSAFAQGLGGGGGASKVVNVQPGAIVVNTVAPGMQVASAVLDRLVAKVAV